MTQWKGKPFVSRSKYILLTIGAVLAIALSVSMFTSCHSVKPYNVVERDNLDSICLIVEFDDPDMIWEHVVEIDSFAICPQPWTIHAQGVDTTLWSPEDECTGRDTTNNFYIFKGSKGRFVMFNYIVWYRTGDNLRMTCESYQTRWLTDTVKLLISVPSLLRDDQLEGH